MPLGKDSFKPAVNLTFPRRHPRGLASMGSAIVAAQELRAKVQRLRPHVRPPNSAAYSSCVREFHDPNVDCARHARRAARSDLCQGTPLPGVVGRIIDDP